MPSKKKVSKKVTKKVNNNKVTKKTTSTTNKKVAKKVTKKTTEKTVKAAKTIKKATKKVSKKKAVIATDQLIHGIEPYVEKPKEEFMNESQQAHFRNILLAWKESLLDEVSKTIHLMQDENINHPDPNDRASQEMDMSLELRNRDRERKLLKKIDSTVLRLDSDEYGWCERCGIEIGIRRLEARPTAELCVDCKTLNEIKERQMI